MNSVYAVFLLGDENNISTLYGLYSTREKAVKDVERLESMSNYKLVELKDYYIDNIKIDYNHYDIS